MSISITYDRAKRGAGRCTVLFLAAKNPTDIRRGRYSNSASPVAKITCGVLPSYDRVGQFPKTRRKVGLVTARAPWKSIAVVRAGRASAVEIETEPRYLGSVPYRRNGVVPNDTHELFILTSSSATVPYRYRRPAVTGNTVRLPLYIPKPRAHILPH